MFWVRIDQKNQVQSTANTVHLEQDSVGRAIFHGKLVGGRVWSGFAFRAALDGEEYKRDNDDFEVRKADYSNQVQAHFLSRIKQLFLEKFEYLANFDILIGMVAYHFNIDH